MSRVANGKLRRTAPYIEGDFYVEVKVYNKTDAASTTPLERWKKALVALKVQINKDTPQWDALQTFMRRVHVVFQDSEPVFYSDNINIK